MKNILSILLALTLLLSFNACNFDNTRTTTDSFTVDISDLSSGKVVCVGSFKVHSGNSLNPNISAKDGVGIMVGLNSNPDLESIEGETWCSSSSSTDEIQTTFPIVGSGIQYIYIGATDTDLENISGTISLNQ